MKWKRWTGMSLMQPNKQQFAMGGYAVGGFLVARQSGKITGKYNPWTIYHAPTQLFFPIADRYRFLTLESAKKWVERLLAAHPELDWSAATADDIVNAQLPFRQAFLNARDAKETS